MKRAAILTRARASGRRGPKHFVEAGVLSLQPTVFPVFDQAGQRDRRALIAKK
jgi:hypothetical protein